MDDLQFASNSDNSKNRKPKPKMVSCEVKAQNETKMGKLASIFIAEDVANVKDYMWNNVIVPNLKTGLCDLVGNLCDILTNSFSMMVSGTPARSRARGGNRNAPFNYGGCFVEPRGSNNVNPAPQNASRADDIPETNFIFPTKDDADVIYQSLLGDLMEYGNVTVSDLYDHVGKTAPGNWQISNVGWKDLSSAYVTKVRQGWLLQLPRVIKL